MKDPEHPSDPEKGDLPPSLPFSGRFKATSIKRPRRSLPHHQIEINLRDVNQLFNSMDPSPFHEKDLDHDAEEFIVSWVQEYHRHDPVTLVVYLQQPPEGADTRHLVEQAVQHYFGYRARLNHLEFRHLMKTGRMSLVIGLVFLTLCLLASELVNSVFHGTVAKLLSETLMIGGTVAMWRPMEIYLYEWWPLRRRGQIFAKMSRMKVEVRQR